MSEPEIANLRAALRYALTVIANYEMDIRNSEWTGVDLVNAGFCQGTVYMGALDTIDRIARGLGAADQGPTE